ncbi:MAG TPA: UbiH/UbiF/VisC/COQ6 family ubiquinone biosynthesis hydroxylase [Gammaproteobacteria bacterium]
MTGRSEPVVLISGAGPVGLALAALLDAVRGDLRICVVEPRELPQWRAEHTDLRVYALSRASQRVLERVGAWPSIAARRACPYERMHVWEGDDPEGQASIRFDCADVGEPDLGHIVEDVLLRDALVTRLAGSSRVRIAAGCAVESVDVGTDAAVVTLSDGATVRANLVVAADGADSPVRAMLDLPAVSRSYRQSAIVAHVATERPHEHVARQRFLRGGPLALLPLADGRSSIVWSLPEPRAERLLAAGDDEFLAALEDASGRVLGRLGPVSRRARFPLQILHALRYCCRRGVLVGDAAHVAHPLAGQGMNLGLADAACLAAEIDAALTAGLDPGDLRVLRRYERRRKADNINMLLALDGLHRLFGLPAAAAPIRAFGLALTDAAGPAKQWLMRRALGLHLDCEATRGGGRVARP